ncbi:hypothetical protein ARMSODRAFT_737041 [Armillaria solidipes]|uniref:Uncharacterized protein n=1 Tax=Armillaria solidipes TaxID=1076256 RepID=A0A2H3AMJ5_9AGAR|nr:hypothetical protein ARMSODRAFT_737041 [Armillaria solidipes]
MMRLVSSVRLLRLMQFGNTDPTSERAFHTLTQSYTKPYECTPPVSAVSYPPAYRASLTSFTYATEDDVLPLAAPIVIKSGETVNNLFIAEGSILTAPLQNLNISEEFFALRGSESEGHPRTSTPLDVH